MSEKWDVVCACAGNGMEYTQSFGIKRGRARVPYVGKEREARCREGKMYRCNRRGE